jgi:hypothetical protein
VAGRALAFADSAVIRLARESFIPVAGDDWYERRRDDDEGRFFRRVADQGPRKGEGGTTRQGIYVLSAGGKLLAYRNHQDPAVILTVLRQGLSKFQELPAEEREPGAVRVNNPATIDANYRRQPPNGGLILNVYTRILDRSDDHEFCRGACSVPGGDKAARDHLWLTSEEWKGLIAAHAKIGDEIAMPNRMVYRLARFHLVDNTRGEPPIWNRAAVRRHDLKLRVAGVTDHGLTLQLDGDILLATDADPVRAERGFDARLAGTIHYDFQRKQIDRFDVVAVGDHWGEGPLTRNARPGRTPLGVAFELARGDSSADHVPPQGARDLREYFRAD